MDAFYSVINHTEDTGDIGYLNKTLESLGKQPVCKEIEEKIEYVRSAIDYVLIKFS